MRIFLLGLIWMLSSCSDPAESLAKKEHKEHEHLVQSVSKQVQVLDSLKKEEEDRVRALDSLKF